MKRNFYERRRVEIEEIERSFNETHREKSRSNERDVWWSI